MHRCATCCARSARSRWTWRPPPSRAPRSPPLDERAGHALFGFKMPSWIVESRLSRREIKAHKETAMQPLSAPGPGTAGALVLCAAGAASVAARLPRRQRERRRHDVAPLASLTHALPSAGAGVSAQAPVSVSWREQRSCLSAPLETLRRASAGWRCHARRAGTLHVDAAAHARGEVPGAADEAAAARRTGACALALREAELLAACAR
jgi:hypothetical protein